METKIKQLRRTKRLECDCVNPPKGIEKFTDKRGLYVMTHPIHELYLTTYYPNIQYRCTKCGAIKRLTIEEKTR